MHLSKGGAPAALGDVASPTLGCLPTGRCLSMGSACILPPPCPFLWGPLLSHHGPAFFTLAVSLTVLSEHTSGPGGPSHLLLPSLTNQGTWVSLHALCSCARLWKVQGPPDGLQVCREAWARTEGLRGCPVPARLSEAPPPTLCDARHADCLHGGRLLGFLVNCLFFPLSCVCMKSSV